MKNTIYLLIAILFLFSCNRNLEKSQPEQEITTEKVVPSNNASDPLLADSLEIRQKFDRVYMTAQMLLKKFTPISKEDSAFLHWTIACRRLISVTNCRDWNLMTMTDLAMPFSLVIADSKLIDSVALNCNTLSMFRSPTLTMAFKAPDNLKSLAPVIVKWNDFRDQNDLLDALQLLHESRHFIQWQYNQNLGKNGKKIGNFERECDAWDFQCRLWIASMSKEQLQMVKERKKIQQSKPMSTSTMTMEDAQLFQNSFGAFPGYWDMFLYYTYGNDYLKLSYAGLSK